MACTIQDGQTTTLKVYLFHTLLYKGLLLGTLLSVNFTATMNVTAMYTNICTGHDLKVPEQIMKMLALNLPQISIGSGDTYYDSHNKIQCI